MHQRPQQCQRDSTTSPPMLRLIYFPIPLTAFPSERRISTLRAHKSLMQSPFERDDKLKAHFSRHALMTPNIFMLRLFCTYIKPFHFFLLLIITSFFILCSHSDTHKGKYTFVVKVQQSCAFFSASISLQVSLMEMPVRDKEIERVRRTRGNKGTNEVLLRANSFYQTRFNYSSLLLSHLNYPRWRFKRNGYKVTNRVLIRKKIVTKLKWAGSELKCTQRLLQSDLRHQLYRLWYHWKLSGWLWGLTRWYTGKSPAVLCSTYGMGHTLTINTRSTPANRNSAVCNSVRSVSYVWNV